MSAVEGGVAQGLKKIMTNVRENGWEVRTGCNTRRENG